MLEQFLNTIFLVFLFVVEPGVACYVLVKYHTYSKHMSKIVRDCDKPSPIRFIIQ